MKAILTPIIEPNLLIKPLVIGGKGNQMTGGKLYDDGGMCGKKTQKFPMTFVIYKNSSKK